MTDFEHLNSSVWARVAPSAVSGVGIVAVRDIPEGTDFADVRFMGFEMDPKRFSKVAPEVRDLVLDQSLQDEEGKVRFFHPNLMLYSFINHSDDPNTDGKVTLRTISKGEELTKDYRKAAKLARISLDHFKSFL